ncbi:MAG: hypothetical protein Ct9H90mP28_5390 [Paracoccaceae bacterium]|jgi:hypothetical protein|nr:MAG: hypothetical protein Ct9H90mP28_5390 [Paracoccaceae bacterium]|tara:strand:- start:1526 stop:1915 length:390 start_codon:yes stop_codon:yes gene_type:complete
MSKLYNVAGGALLHEELNDNYWKDKAKKLIKDGESVPDALGLCLSRLEFVLKSDDFGNTNYWYTLGLIRAANTLHTWLLDVLKEMENEERREMTIRVSLKKGLPMQSVNKNILSYLRPSLSSSSLNWTR